MNSISLYLLLSLFGAAAATCVDDDYFAYNNDPLKGCNWVGNNDYVRCGFTWNGKPLSYYCPLACNACSAAATQAPTKKPTRTPTKTPTKSPTRAPTKIPTKAPTKTPTKAPTKVPTKAPTKKPTTPIPNDSIAVDYGCYVQGDDIKVTFNNYYNPMFDDWIGIYQSSLSPSALPSPSSKGWVWACGSQVCGDEAPSGTVVFYSANFSPGYYKAYLVRDNPNGSPYTSYAMSISFQIKDSYSTC